MSALRGLAAPLGGIAAVFLIYLVNPWFAPEGAVRQFVTWGFWIASILLVLALFEDRRTTGATEVEVEGPAWSRFLFNNSRAGLLWLPIRLFVGFEWLEAGLHKIVDPGWTQGGASLLRYWTSAAAVPQAGRVPISYDWYRDFINLLISNQAQTWFAWLVTLGELAIGLALILGVLTGVAAFFGALLNMSFLLAGSGSSNPVLFTLAIGLVLAWRVAGYYGVDRVLLPRLGTPWRPGALFLRQRQMAAQQMR